ncbi:hypothetical protein [Lysobacter auxotrophicus]|uniref:Uncharacterized protein n=1 Tax=Lysobacter auxotrophicus TaxID=2992573 RepID=A0ABM8DHF7_9GAMM|nr:hypothetical protein [Lysobacter auxotrophicus]BDU17993.1 hypothetical protein LA521A_31940 [Lysobacter auxotrophicus]
MKLAMPPNAIPRGSLYLTFAFLAYGTLVVRNGLVAGPWASGTALGIGFSLCIAGTLLTMFIAARRAYRAGRLLWMLATLLVWPLAYIYALYVDRGR